MKFVECLACDEMTEKKHAHYSKLYDAWLCDDCYNNDDEGECDE